MSAAAPVPTATSAAAAVPDLPPRPLAATAEAPAPERAAPVVVAAEEILGGRRAAAIPADRYRACHDSASTAEPWKVSGTYRWYYNAGGAPRKVSRSALAATRSATASVARAANDCGLRARPRLGERYGGRTRHRPQVDANGRCTGNDGYSVAG